MQSLERDTILKLEGISKRFGKEYVLEDISFEVNKGEFLSLLGPSGSGKTTLLRIILGLEYPERGKVVLKGKTISSPEFSQAPYKRKIGMVFQDLSLWPHMNVEEHILFALSGLKIKTAEKKEKLNRLLKRLSLEEYSKRFPHQLSGGEKQRLAIARALAAEPEMLLLDEPLVNLDLNLKIDVQKELLALNKSLGITLLYVTHEQMEALMLSQRIILLNSARIEQIDSPDKLINSPKSLFVKNFIRFSSDDIEKIRARLLAG